MEHDEGEETISMKEDFAEPGEGAEDAGDSGDSEDSGAESGDQSENDAAPKEGVREVEIPYYKWLWRTGLVYFVYYSKKAFLFSAETLLPLAAALVVLSLVAVLIVSLVNVLVRTGVNIGVMVPLGAILVGVCSIYCCGCCAARKGYEKTEAEVRRELKRLKKKRK